MTDLEMQIGWALIKKMAFKPSIKEQNLWIKQLNLFRYRTIGNPINISHRDLTNSIKLDFIHVVPRISDKSTLRIHSIKPEIIFEINLHHDKGKKIESETDTSNTKDLTKILNNEGDVIEVLKNYIEHPAIHIHLPEVDYENRTDVLHEIRIAAGSENFFYLMYQIFFQTIDFENRYDYSEIKKAELERLAKIIWHKRRNIEPIGPGILFPTGKK